MITFILHAISLVLSLISLVAAAILGSCANEGDTVTNRIIFALVALTFVAAYVLGVIA
ncbi:hypothetical protein [Tritonibacter mobilis]|uniref:hypothetical protein n=1 Tax=Tritonibacter mobilis TaxID=379347 RepID=UPI000AA2D970|nr:hypothetical protein [Tritonibacter mobilis]